MKTINIRATLLCAFLLLAIPMATTTVAGATDLYDGPLTPIGFKIVNGKSTGNPITIKTEDLVKSPGYTHTESSPGTYTTPEAVIETDDREQITDTTKTPYRWLGRVGFTMEDGRKNHCTGFLVSSDTVVTAGHCVSGKVSDITFTPGVNGDTAPFPTAKATQIWYDNKVFLPNPQQDWGVIKLDTPIGDKVGWFGMAIPNDEDLIGRQATVIGYPTTYPGKPEATLWKDRNTITGITPIEITHIIDTTRGQSGGPILSDTNTVYGIHKGGSAYANVGNRMTTELFNLIVNVSKM